jgi:hypothetical protein
MRRLVFPMIVAFGLLMIGAGSASAEPAPTAGTAKAVAGKKICKVTDPKLDELSGIVATKDGFIVINDSTTLENHKRVFYLNNECAITKSVKYSGNGPRDTEDMILSPDGKTLWIADIGDNDATRDTVGLWTMPADGSASPKIHRLRYPSGERHDAEALLLNGDGTPIIVTKEVGKPAGVYTPAAALKTDNTEGVPMKKVGQVTVPPSDTSANAFSRLGRGTIDGGAIAPGGERVVLRTYTDALEWTVSGGDVLAAIQGKPRVTPLPDEQLGEAITYSPDGKYFYTVSDMQARPQDGENNILRYEPAANIVAAKATTAGAADESKGASWFSNLSLNDITKMLGAVGILGAILVGVGIFGIVRARKRPPSVPLEDAAFSANPSAAGPTPMDAETEFVPFRGPQGQQPNVYRGSPQPGVYGGSPKPGGYGGAPQPGSGPKPGVYGGAPQPGGGPKPGVYGGRPQSGGGAQSGGSPEPGVPGGSPQPGVYGGRPAPSGTQRGSGVYGGSPGTGRTGAAGSPAARPGSPAARPGPPAARPAQGAPPGARAGQGQGAPAAGRTGQGAAPGGRPGQSAQPAGQPGQGGQPGGRSGQPAGRAGAGGGSRQPGRPTRGGVYGAPSAPPQEPARNAAAGQSRRPSGFLGAGRADTDRDDDEQDFADVNGSGRGRDYGSPGYGRTPYSR